MPGESLLPDDLAEALEALQSRVNVCPLVSVTDIVDLLPRRVLSAPEAGHFLAALAAAEVEVIEPDAADRLQHGP